MPEIVYRNRRAVRLEDDHRRVTVLVEGGHVAEILHKPSGVNPLWTPPWPSIEPSTYDPGKHPEYGGDAESRLLAGIMGHNLCMDIFGPPSDEEAAAGLPVHGEASVAPYRMEVSENELVAQAELPAAQLRLERRIALADMVIRFTETVENVSATDRPIGWTQHVTLGPPFLQKGSTQFRAPATRSKVYLSSEGHMQAGAEFDWPMVPGSDGSTADMRVYTAAPVSGGYTAHLMDPTREQAFFMAWSPDSQVLLGYVWKRSDFPWLGIWEENYSRTNAPWNGAALTRGMEFGVSPYPETRRQMVDRGSLFGVPGYRWIPAKSRVSVEYGAFIGQASALVNEVFWNGSSALQFDF